MVEEKLAFPGSVSQYLDSARSALNPYNRDFGSFVYGTLPIVLAKAAGMLLHKTGYDGTYLVGRVLSTLFDLLTVLLVYRIARRFAGRATSLFAAALLSFCAFAIQLSHFWTVDTFLTTFTALVLLGSVRLAQGRAGWLEDAGIGLCLGLAVACKITALALLLPVGVGILVRAFPGLKAGRSRGQVARRRGPALRRRPRRDRPRRARRVSVRLRGTEPVLLPSRPALDQGPEEPRESGRQRRRIPAEPPVGRAHAALSDPQLRAAGRRACSSGWRRSRPSSGRSRRPGLAGGWRCSRSRSTPSSSSCTTACRSSSRCATSTRRIRRWRSSRRSERTALARRGTQASGLASPALRSPRRARRYHPLGARVLGDLRAPAHAGRGLALDLRERPAAVAHRQRVLGRRPAVPDAGPRQPALLGADARPLGPGQPREGRARSSRRWTRPTGSRSRRTASTATSRGSRRSSR